MIKLPIRQLVEECWVASTEYSAEYYQGLF